MAFTSFTCVDDVVKKYKLTFVQGPLVPPAPTAPPFGDFFREELAFNLRKLPIGRSEIGAKDILGDDEDFDRKFRPHKRGSHRAIS